MLQLAIPYNAKPSFAESVLVQLVSSIGGTSVLGNAVSLTIVVAEHDDPTGVFALSPASAAVTSDNPFTQLSVLRLQGAYLTVTVAWALSGDTGAITSSVNGTLTFGPGVTSLPIAIAWELDSFPHLDQQCIVDIAIIGTFGRVDSTAASATATLQAYGGIYGEFSLDQPVFAGYANGSYISAVVNRSLGQEGDVLVSLNVRALSSVESTNLPADTYPAFSSMFVASRPTSVVFTSLGAASLAFNVFIPVNATPDASRAFVVEILAATLLAPVDGISGPSTPLVSRAANKSLCIIQAHNFASGVFGLTNTNILVSESVRQYSLTVKRAAGSFGRVLVAFSFNGISAVMGTDFQPITSSPLVFAPAVTSQQILFTTLPNAIPELDLSFSVTLTSVTGGVVLDGPALSSTNASTIVTISAHDDPNGVYSFTSTSAITATKGSLVSIPVARNFGLFGTVSVAWSANLNLGTSPTLQVRLVQDCSSI